MTAVAAIYARKSTSQAGRDDDDKSVARQVANARAFAEGRGWLVNDHHVYCDDGISGAADLRKLPAKQALIDAIHSGKAPFQVLVMQSNDRLSRRDGDEALAELKSIARAGIQVWFYADGTQFEFGTFQTNTVAFLKAEFAAEYRRQVAAKTREALVRKAQLGHVTGNRVFGYDNVRLNSHVERRVNPAEAAVILRIYELFTEGAGLASIAHTLNSEAAISPRAQQGRVTGWCASSIREVLKRPLYRGEMVYGKTQKRGPDGQVRPRRQPESQWVRIPLPASLRIVPQHLADSVDARFATTQARALRLHNGRLLGRTPGEGSRYLLTGLLRCSVCGGGMEVLSRKSTAGRRVFEYRCYVSRRKGRAVCPNNLPAPMADTDSAVLRMLSKKLLNPEVVCDALDQAEAWLATDRTGDVREALEAQLAHIEGAAQRITAAIAQGGELPPLIAALEAQQRERRDVLARIESLRPLFPRFDPVAVRAELAGYLADWQKFLRGHVEQAQQAIRRLVKGRLTMTPQADGSYAFSGTGTVKPLLGGLIQNLASPPGFEPGFQP